MKIELDLVHLKKDRTDASIYQQLFMEIRDRYHGYIPVYTDGSWDGNSVACATVFPSNTIISMRLPDSASIFTVEIWAIIKALEEIQNSVASQYIVFTDSLSCLQALQSMKLEHPLIGMVICKVPFLILSKKILLALGVMKGQTLLPSLHWICLMPRLVYPIMILNTVSAHIFVQLGKMNGMVRLRTSFVLGDWQSSYRLCRKDEVVLCHTHTHIGHTHLTNSYILRKARLPVCEHCILSSPQFGRVQSLLRKERYVW